MLAFEDQDKESFVDALQKALVDYGAGRYECLRSNPFVYYEKEGRAWLRRDGELPHEVTRLSLPTIALVVIKSI